MADPRTFLAPSGNLRVRDPLSNSQVNGVVVNPPRFNQIGGLKSASEGVKRNRYTIKKPGNTAG